MSSFQKMVLLSQDELERIKAKQLKEYDPQYRAMARIQDQIESLQARKDMPSDEKVKQLATMRTRFEEIKNEGQPQTKLEGVMSGLEARPTPQPAAAPAPAAPLPPASAPVPLIGIPARLHGEAEQLWKILLNHPEIFQVTPDMELVSHGTPVQGSNILDLVSDIFASSKAKVKAPRPPGYSDFLNILHEVNAPRSLIKNPSVAQGLELLKFHPPSDESSTLTSSSIAASSTPRQLRSSSHSSLSRKKHEASSGLGSSQATVLKLYK